MPYDLDPLLLLLSYILLLVFLLSLDEVHVHDGHEQIHAEDTSDQDENNKNDIEIGFVVGVGPVDAAVDGLFHLFRPGLEGGEGEEREHRLEDVVVVEVVSDPDRVGVGVGLGVALVPVHIVEHVDSVILGEFLQDPVAEIEFVPEQVGEDDSEHEPI